MYPWIFPALAWMAGIAVADGRAWPFWPVWTTTTLALGIAALGIHRTKPLPSFVTVLLACLLGGITRTLLAQTPLDPLDLRHHLPPHPVLVTVEGTLLDTPQISTPTLPGSAARVSASASLQLHTIQPPTETATPRHGLIRVRWKGSLPERMHAGMVIRTEGVLSPIPPAVAPGLFDPALVYGRRHCYFELKSDSPDRVDILAPREPEQVPWREKFQRWGMQTLSRGLRPTDPHIQSCWNMVLGSSMPIPAETKEAYLKTGTLHIFAISGLHITLLTQILTHVLRTLGCPGRWASALVLPLIWTYTALTGWQASAIRATIMASVLECGTLLARPSSMLNSLFAAAFFILAWDPDQLFQTGFQLSFLVVLALACGSDWIKRDSRPPDSAQVIQDPSDWIPVAQRSSRHRHWARLRGHVQSGLRMSAAAWLISAPLIAQAFHLCTPVSLLANLAIVPLSSLVLGCCLASLFTGEICTWMNVAFNHAAWFLMDVMTQIAQGITHLPGAWFYVEDLGADGLAISYLLIIGTLPWIWKTPRRQLLFWSSLACTISASLLHRSITQPDLEIHVLPVRGAGTVWMEFKSADQRSLLNGGSLQEATWVTVPFLHAQGCHSIPHWIITHPNTANMGGSSFLEQEMNPCFVFLPPANRRSPAYRAWTQARTQKNIPGQTWSAASRHPLWKPLFPPAHTTIERSAEAGLVLQCTINEHRILILPDLPRRTQERLVELAAPQLPSEILLTGIFSETDSLSATLLEQIRPRWVLICDQGRPWTAEGKEQLRQQIQNGGAQAAFLSDWGYLRVSVREKEVRMERYEGGLRGRGYRPLGFHEHQRP